MYLLAYKYLLYINKYPYIVYIKYAIYLSYTNKLEGIYISAPLV